VTTRRTFVVAAVWLAAVSGTVALLYAARTPTGLTGGQMSRDAVAPRSFGIWLREGRR